eukprot:1173273-Prorocentrum_minimum.AAC.1
MLRLREAEFDVDKVRLSVPQLKAVLVMLTGCKPKGNKPELLKSLVEVTAIAGPSGATGPESATGAPTALDDVRVALDFDAVPN